VQYRQIDRQTDGQTDGQTYRQTYRQTDRHGQTNRPTDQQTDRQTDRQTDARTSFCAVHGAKEKPGQPALLVWVGHELAGEASVALTLAASRPYICKYGVV
jgi:hypothetical protein